MRFIIDLMPLPIGILFLVGFVFTLYKISHSNTMLEKQRVGLKYLIYLLYFIVIQFVISPLLNPNNYISMAFLTVLLLLSAFEIYRIKSNLKAKHLLLFVLIMLGTVLLFRFRQGMLELYIFYCVFIFDGMSQIGGQVFGKHKLSPKISPNKTWEGFFTGLIFSVVSMLILDNVNDYVFIKSQYFKPIFYSMICSLALIGDLFFSKLKRLSNIKDFGNYIPGHGGLLDRIDSLIFTNAIVFYIYFIIFIVLLCTSDGLFPIY